MPVIVLAVLALLSSTAVGAQEPTHRATIAQLAGAVAAGRGFGTEALVMQQTYAAERFAAAGLRPIGATDFFHPFRSWFSYVDSTGMVLRREASLPPWDRWSARASHALLPLVDWLVLDVGGRPLRAPIVPESANVVFGGRLGSPGAIGPSEVTGRIVLFDPPQLADGREDFDVLAYATDLEPYRAADALMFAVLDLTPSARRRVARTLRTNDRSMQDGGNGPPIIAISDHARRVILNEQLRPGWQYGLSTPGLRRHRITLGFREVQSATGPSGRNVIGEVAGTDRDAAQEYIVVMGRLDHLGVEPARATGFFQPPRVDSVYFGADIGGTSAAVALALADRIAAAPTRRSVLFVLTGGAEGAFGALAMLAQSPVPTDRIVAVVSADRVGQPTADSLAAFGLAADGVAGAFRLRAATGPAPGWVCASDHAAVARRGTKSVLLTTGATRRIEPLHDRASSIDYAHVGRVTDAIEEVVRALGDGAPAVVPITGGPPIGCDRQ